jgi:hypothetical protein
MHTIAARGPDAHNTPAENTRSTSPNNVAKFPGGGCDDDDDDDNDDNDDDDDNNDDDDD